MVGRLARKVRNPNPARRLPRNEELMQMLKRYRLARGLSRKSLGSQLGVHHTTVATWESGRSIPRDRLFPKLAKILGVDPLELTKIIAPEISHPGQLVH
jgi:transcriptional regulator with XRE-family HTH domain